MKNVLPLMDVQREEEREDYHLRYATLILHSPFLQYSVQEIRAAIQADPSLSRQIALMSNSVDAVDTKNQLMTLAGKNYSHSLSPFHFHF